jgi:cysteine synthase
MRMKEEEGVIEPGKAPLLETSTGNSGASFAWLCRELGYEAEVFIPADMPSTRIAQIESLGAKVHLSPAGEYVNGLIGSFREYLRSNPKYKALNHADDEFHTIAAMNDLAREIIRDLNDLGVRQIDYFVSALGNGTTTRGIGAVLKRQYRTSIIGVEPIESPTVFQQRFPEKCRRLYGEISQSGQHGLLGTGPGVVDFTFQNMRLISEEIEDFVIVSRQDWESRLIELQSLEGQFVGHTSAACLHAALELAQRVSNKIMVQLFYDPYWKYLYVNGQSG